MFVHIGALSDKAGFHFAENAGKGGPLGELVQWSDLIAALYALGYNIDFSTEISQLRTFLVVNYNGGCPSASETKYIAVFVDIVGLKQLKKLTRNRFQMYKYVINISITGSITNNVRAFACNYCKLVVLCQPKGHLIF